MYYLADAYNSLVVKHIKELGELRRRGVVYDDGVFGRTRTRLVWCNRAVNVLAKFFGIAGEEKRMDTEFNVVHL